MQIYSYKEIRDTDEFGMLSYWMYIIKSFVYKLTFFFANYTRFTPNQITIMSFIFGLLSAYFFLNGTWFYLIIGALLFQCSFILDIIDGKVARLKGLKSAFGAYLDAITDLLKYFFIILGLAYGQYKITNDLSLLFYGYLLMFFHTVFMASTYIIRVHKPEYGNSRNDVYQSRSDILNKKLPFIGKLKTKIDPENKLIFVPNDTETIGFFIAPILMEIKLGFILCSIILFINIMAMIIFNFVMKKD